MELLALAEWQGDVDAKARDWRSADARIEDYQTAIRAGGQR